MKESSRWAAWAVAAAALLVAGCGGGGGGSYGGGIGGAPVVTQLDPSASVRVAGAIDRPSIFGAGQIAGRPATTQTVSFTSGTASQSHVYTGANLWQFLSDAGIQTDASKKNDILNRYLLATGADGYKVVFALGELSPDFGNKPSLVAYAEAVNGLPAPLPSGDGPFRVTAPGDVKGGRYVSMLTRFDLRPSGSTAAGIAGGGPAPSFAVSGSVTQAMRFDLAALQALPVTTQTVGGSVYTGVSLWTLLNTVTGLQTDNSAKNPTLAMYAVATGSDGYKAMVSLGEIDPGFGNRTALVAYAVGGAGLGANGAARLVVPGDVKLGRAVSNLVAIEVFAAPAAQ